MGQTHYLWLRAGATLTLCYHECAECHENKFTQSICQLPRRAPVHVAKLGGGFKPPPPPFSSKFRDTWESSPKPHGNSFPPEFRDHEFVCTGSPRVDYKNLAICACVFKVALPANPQPQEKYRRSTFTVKFDLFFFAPHEISPKFHITSGATLRWCHRKQKFRQKLSLRLRFRPKKSRDAF